MGAQGATRARGPGSSGGQGSSGSSVSQRISERESLGELRKPGDLRELRELRELLEPGEHRELRELGESRGFSLYGLTKWTMLHTVCERLGVPPYLTTSSESVCMSCPVCHPLILSRVCVTTCVTFFLDYIISLCLCIKGASITEFGSK